MNTYQKIALACILSLILLIFVGAIVRVTGSGMGCPDWPMCWGKLIPPTSVEQVDVATLVEKKAFVREYQHINGPDAKLSQEALKEMFNPTHTWIEYVNRLTSMPIGFSSLALFVYAFFKYRKSNKRLYWFSFFAFFLVLLNAVIGAIVVKTSLDTGVITTHMALAMLLLCVLVYVYWKGAERQREFSYVKSPVILRKLGWLLFWLIIFEGVMGSQVREMTDTFMKEYGQKSRPTWTAQLEETWMYVIHRSFSWVVLAASIGYFILAKKCKTGGLSWLEWTVVGIVFAQMVLGLVLSKVGVLAVVQVLHIGLSSILVAVLYYWLLCLGKKTVKT